jgi:hypothetical protein
MNVKLQDKLWQLIGISQSFYDNNKLSGFYIHVLRFVNNVSWRSHAAAGKKDVKYWFDLMEDVYFCTKNSLYRWTFKLFTFVHFFSRTLSLSFWKEDFLWTISRCPVPWRVVSYFHSVRLTCLSLEDISYGHWFDIF